MNIIRMTALAGLILIGAFPVAGFAATNSAPVRLPGKKMMSRTIMRSGFNPVTDSIDAVTVDEGPLIHTAQMLAWGAGGDIVGKDDVSKQAGQVMNNLLLAIKAARGLDNNLIKVNVYVSRSEDMPKVKDTMMHWRGAFGQAAISFVTGKLTNPDALVAMDAVALSDVDEPGVNRIRLPRLSALKCAAASVLPGGGKYYVSGQAKNGALPEAVKGTLASLETTLKFLGLGKSSVVQVKAFLQPISSANLVQTAVSNFFAPDLPPPTVFVEWSSATNNPIEIELIAADSIPQFTNGNSVDYLTPPELPASKVFSRVAHVNHGKMIYFSSFIGSSPGTGYAQINDIFVYLDYLLPRVGSDFDHLVKATYYVTDDDASTKLNEIRPKFYSPQRPPAASKATVTGVGFADRTLAIDLIGVTR